MVATSPSSSENDVSLSADQEKAPTATHDTAFSSMVSERRGGVPS